MQKRRWWNGALGLLLAMALTVAVGLIPVTALAGSPEEGIAGVEPAGDGEVALVMQDQDEEELEPEAGLDDELDSALSVQDTVYYWRWNGTEFEEGHNASFENIGDFWPPERGHEYGQWLVLKDDVTLTNRLKIVETVNLVLRDGQTLTASKGIEVAAGATLNIYAEVGGTGRIIATGEDNNAGIGGSKGIAGGRVFIHGGKVIATGGKNAAGIGGGNGASGGTVAVYRGTVNDVVYGGTVVATGDENAMGIGRGYNGGDDGDLTVEDHTTLVSTNDANWSVYDGSARTRYMKVGEICTVTLTGGANATTSGATTQAFEKGSAMQAVTYTAKGGYHFDSFKPITVDGVTAELNPEGKVCVSGTPTGDVSIAIPDAVANPVPAKVAKPSTVVHPGTGKLDVSWKAADNAESYEVQWRKAGGKWKTAATQSLKYTISGLKKGGAYEVRVRAKNKYVSGAWSSSARCWMRSPSSVKAKKGTKKGAIKVSWNKDRKATDGFKVYVYAKKGGKLVKTVKAKAGKTSVTVRGLKAGKRYYVRVRPIRKVSGKTYVGTISGYRSAMAAK